MLGLIVLGMMVQAGAQLTIWHGTLLEVEEAFREGRRAGGSALWEAAETMVVLYRQLYMSDLPASYPNYR